jgi:hypothetical protein
MTAWRDTLTDGLWFGGYLQPPYVPADPLEQDWRGPPGPPGPQGPPGPAGGMWPIALVPIVGGTVTLDAAASSGVFRVNLTANITAISLINAPAGRETDRQLELIGDGTARSVNFGAWTLVTGTPVPTSAAGRKDVYELTSDGVNVLVWLTAQNVPA